jgi:signal transduction histidine kinase
MNNFIDRKILFLIVTVLIVFQLFLFLIYEQYNQRSEQNDITNLLIQKNISLVQRVKSSKSKIEIVKNTHIPSSIITLSPNPKWIIQDASSSLWGIYGKMKRQKNPIRISIKIAEKQWMNIEIISSLAHSLTRYLLIGSEIFVTMFLIAFLWLIYHHTVPLRLIADAAKRLGIDVNTQPLKMKGPMIARHAFQSINEMQTKIKNLIQERTLMLASISHDLRTPLTSLRLRNELIDHPEISQKNHQNMDEMETMISQILAFTKEDYFIEKKSKLDLTALVISICHDSLDRGQSVKYLGPDNERIIYNGCLLSLKRAFINIIDNAVKYGGSAEVELFFDVNDKINLIIRDYGPGILEKHMDKVFTPFYRVDTSRSRKKSGIGLGLAIARNIIYAHGGCITLKQMQPTGLQVAVTFPTSI